MEGRTELVRGRRLGIREVREQLWRYHPQMLELIDEVAADWFLDLWRLVPVPDKAIRIGEKTLERLLKQHRIRRLDAAQILERLRAPPIPGAPGTIAAATAHLETVAKRLELINRQLVETNGQLDRLTEQLVGAQDGTEGQSHEQRDVTILRSLPGVGRIVLATLLAEAWDALQRRDYHAMRCL